MIPVHSIQNNLSGLKAIFEIHINNKNVYMGVSATWNMEADRERYVVLVDGEKLLQLWRKEPNGIHTDISMGQPTTWRNDKKFAGLERAFSHGLDSPVPLANISCQQHRSEIAIYRPRFFIFREFTGIKSEIFDYVAFNDGITRTIWLLTNGAKYFPVECGVKNEAKRLAKVAGYSQDSIMSVSELIGSFNYQ